MTYRDKFAHRQLASVSGSRAEITLETTVDDEGVSLNVYTEEGGTLALFEASTSARGRERMLALGRAIVGALDPVVGPPQEEEPLAEWERELLDAPWQGPTPTGRLETPRSRLERLIGEGIGAASMCWDETPSGVFHSRRAASIVDAILAAVDVYDAARYPLLSDRVAEVESPALEAAAVTPLEFEFAGDQHLPLDVELRTFAIEKALVALEGGAPDPAEVVAWARVVEAYLAGADAEPEAEPESEPEPEVRFYVERGAISCDWVVRDRVRPARGAPFSERGFAERAARELNEDPEGADGWAWIAVTP